jgi:hypothetical protein
MDVRHEFLIVRIPRADGRLGFLDHSLSLVVITA